MLRYWILLVLLCTALPARAVLTIDCRGRRAPDSGSHRAICQRRQTRSEHY